MIKVKLCGLNRVEDIFTANRLQADYAGFVFASSKRQVSPMRARALRKSLAPTVTPVGVFVDMPVTETAAIAQWCGMAVVQLHGGENARFIRTLRTLLPPNFEIWKAARVRTTADIWEAAATGADRLVLDAFSSNAMGGTGGQFDWDILKGCEIPLPFFLAGGLNPLNVADAVRLVRPFGVDVSSGVETDGVKDPDKMAQFIWAARGENTASDGG